MCVWGVGGEAGGGGRVCVCVRTFVCQCVYDRARVCACIRKEKQMYDNQIQYFGCSSLTVEKPTGAPHHLTQQVHNTLQLTDAEEVQRGSTPQPSTKQIVVYVVSGRALSWTEGLGIGAKFGVWGGRGRVGGEGGGGGGDTG